MSEIKRKRCFIITPIGKETDPIRRHIDGIIDAAIIPALGEKYEIVVAHKITTPGTITKQIISEIYSDELVIANLTDRNPNVMYELAFRHAIGKPVIMISDKDTILPADIIMERTIFYQNDAKGVLELREDLIKAEKAIDFDIKAGPIIDILGDISHDTSVLASVNTEEKEPLEYIMNRLTKIEEAVLTSNRKLESRIIKDRPLRERSLVFTADIPEEFSENESIIKQIIENAKEQGFNISKLDVFKDIEEIHIVFIDVEMRPYLITFNCFRELFGQFNIILKERVR